MNLYLSRVRPNPRHRAVRHDLADCHAFHRTVMSAFPQMSASIPAREALGVLYRLDLEPRTGRLHLLVQSRHAPEWAALQRTGYLLPEIDTPVKPIGPTYDALVAGMRLRFRVRANPTRRFNTPPGPDGTRPPGKRVELRDDEARIAWLRRKGEAGGFHLLDVRTTPGVPDLLAQLQGKQTGRRSDIGRNTPNHGSLTFGAVLFDGALEITEPEAFRRTLTGGIGSGKAYGFGLLSIASLTGGR